MEFARTSHGMVHIVDSNLYKAICGQEVQIPMEPEGKTVTGFYSYSHCRKCWRKADVVWVEPSEGYYEIQ